MDLKNNTPSWTANTVTNSECKVFYYPLVKKKKKKRKEKEKKKKTKCPKAKKLTEDFIHGIYHFYDLYDQRLNMWRF